MTDHRRYLLTEMAISAVINGVLSLVFVFALFGRRVWVPVSGTGGLIADAAPQTFMVALMSMLVPTLLTRRRIRSGAVTGLPGGRSGLPQHALIRALVVALISAGVGTGVQALLLPLGPVVWSFAVLAPLKTVYGAAIGAGLALIATLAVLREPGAVAGR